MPITLNLIAVPVLAALAAGTGALATFVKGSDAAPPVAIAAQADQPCATQTWPYIDGKCITSGQAKPKVRVVMAPRSMEDVSGSASAASPAVVPQAPVAVAPQGAPLLTSRDTVLRQPEPLASPKGSKAREKRSDQRREKRMVVQSYQVPAEFDREARSVIVVRPLRREAFR